MKTSDFNYDLPKELIAQVPIKERDMSRLLVLDRKNGKTFHNQNIKQNGFRTTERIFFGTPERPLLHFRKRK